MMKNMCKTFIFLKNKETTNQTKGVLCFGFIRGKKGFSLLEAPEIKTAGCLFLWFLTPKWDLWHKL